MDYNLVLPLTTDQIRRLLLALYHFLREIKRSFVKINFTQGPYQWMLGGTNVLETLSLQVYTESRLYWPTKWEDWTFFRVQENWNTNPNFTHKLFMYIHIPLMRDFTVLPCLQTGILWFENVSPSLSKDRSSPVSSACSFTSSQFRSKCPLANVFGLF